MRYCYFSRSNEILLDLDTIWSFRTFRKRYSKVKDLIKNLVITSTCPNHFHVYITLKTHHRFINLSALQTYLGSDFRRELSNVSRIVSGATKPILLIEFFKVKQWREPDIVCACPKKWKGKKLSNCIHLRRAKGHSAKFGYLSTRLKILGIENPYKVK